MSLNDSHSHTETGQTRHKAKGRLMIAWVLTLFLFVAELVGGIFSNSLSLLSDAGHMMGDLAALTLTLVSIYWSLRKANPKKTFGYHRAEILATFLNGALLTYISFQICWEAGVRFMHPELVRLSILFPVAAAGLAANLASAVLLSGFHHHMVTRSAFYHVISDALSSISVLVGGFILYKTGWSWIDPALSVLIAILIFRNSVLLLKEAYDILMEGSPSGIDLKAVEQAVLQITGVSEIHDLHIWTIGSGFVAASAHVLLPNMDIEKSSLVVAQISKMLDEKFSIHHATIQVAAVPSPAKIQKL